MISGDEEDLFFIKISFQLKVANCERFTFYALIMIMHYAINNYKYIS